MYEIVYLEDALNEIRNWPIKVRVNYFRIASLIEIRGPNLGMPHTRAMGKGLFEVRAKGAEGIGRAFFCTVKGKKVIVLHAFIKKSAKTPKQDLDLALKRMAEVNHEEFFNEQMKDPEFAKAYEESEEEFKALQKAIELRMQQKLSQTEVAQRMNTTRSVVCRLEAGLSNGTPPSLGMLKRYAIALGKKVEIRLV